jgi:hypothetical protein
MLLIGFALLRGTAIGGLSLVSQQVVNLWFVQRRGIAAAAASLGLAAGSMVFPRFFDYLIALHGWRGAYLALAVLVALTILPVAAALFRDRPEKFGLTPDAGLPPVGAMPREEPSFTHKEALRTGAFWLLCAIGFLTNAVGTALLLNHFSIMDVAGVERDEALRVLALYAAVQVAATLGTGVLLDRHEPAPLGAAGDDDACGGLRVARAWKRKHCQLALPIVPRRRIWFSASDRRSRVRPVFWPRSPWGNPRCVLCVRDQRRRLWSTTVCRKRGLDRKLCPRPWLELRALRRMRAC